MSNEVLFKKLDMVHVLLRKDVSTTLLKPTIDIWLADLARIALTPKDTIHNKVYFSVVVPARQSMKKLIHAADANSDPELVLANNKALKQLKSPEEKFQHLTVNIMRYIKGSSPTQSEPVKSKTSSRRCARKSMSLSRFKAFQAEQNSNENASTSATSAENNAIPVKCARLPSETMSSRMDSNSEEETNKKPRIRTEQTLRVDIPRLNIQSLSPKRVISSSSQTSGRCVVQDSDSSFRSFSSTKLAQTGVPNLREQPGKGLNSICYSRNINNTTSTSTCATSGRGIDIKTRDHQNISSSTSPSSSSPRSAQHGIWFSSSFNSNNTKSTSTCTSSGRSIDMTSREHQSRSSPSSSKFESPKSAQRERRLSNSSPSPCINFARTNTSTSSKRTDNTDTTITHSLQSSTDSRSSSPEKTHPMPRISSTEHIRACDSSLGKDVRQGTATHLTSSGTDTEEGRSESVNGGISESSGGVVNGSGKGTSDEDSDETNDEEDYVELKRKKNTKTSPKVDKGFKFRQSLGKLTTLKQHIKSRRPGSSKSSSLTSGGSGVSLGGCVAERGHQQSSSSSSRQEINSRGDTRKKPIVIVLDSDDEDSPSLLQEQVTRTLPSASSSQTTITETTTEKHRMEKAQSKVKIEHHSDEFSEDVGDSDLDEAYSQFTLSQSATEIKLEPSPEGTFSEDVEDSDMLRIYSLFEGSDSKKDGTHSKRVSGLSAGKGPEKDTRKDKDMVGVLKGTIKTEPKSDYHSNKVPERVRNGPNRELDSQGKPERTRYRGNAFHITDYLPRQTQTEQPPTESTHDNRWNSQDVPNGLTLKSPLHNFAQWTRRHDSPTSATSLPDHGVNRTECNGPQSLQTSVSRDYPGSSLFSQIECSIACSSRNEQSEEIECSIACSSRNEQSEEHATRNSLSTTNIEKSPTQDDAPTDSEYDSDLPLSSIFSSKSKPKRKKNKSPIQRKRDKRPRTGVVDVKQIIKNAKSLFGSEPSNQSTISCNRESNCSLSSSGDHEGKSDDSVEHGESSDEVCLLEVPSFLISSSGDHERRNECRKPPLKDGNISDDSLENDNSSDEVCLLGISSGDVKHVKLEQDKEVVEAEEVDEGGGGCLEISNREDEHDNLEQGEKVVIEAEEEEVREEEEEEEEEGETVDEESGQLWTSEDLTHPRQEAEISLNDISKQVENDRYLDEWYWGMDGADSQVVKSVATSSGTIWMDSYAEENDEAMDMDERSIMTGPSTEKEYAEPSVSETTTWMGSDAEKDAEEMDVDETHITSGQSKENKSAEPFAPVWTGSDAEDNADVMYVGQTSITTGTSMEKESAEPSVGETESTASSSVSEAIWTDFDAEENEEGLNVDEIPITSGPSGEKESAEPSVGEAESWWERGSGSDEGDDPESWGIQESAMDSIEADLFMDSQHEEDSNQVVEDFNQAAVESTPGTSYLPERSVLNSTSCGISAENHSSSTFTSTTPSTSTAPGTPMPSNMDVAKPGNTDTAVINPGPVRPLSQLQVHMVPTVGTMPHKVPQGPRELFNEPPAILDSARNFNEDDLLVRVLSWKASWFDSRGNMLKPTDNGSIPKTFDSIDQYYDVFAPLVEMEAQEQASKEWHDPDASKKKMRVMVDSAFRSGSRYTVIQCSAHGIPADIVNRRLVAEESDLLIIVVDAWRCFALVEKVDCVEVKRRMSSGSDCGDMSPSKFFNVSFTLRTRSHYRPSERDMMEISYVTSLLTTLRQWCGLMSLKKSLLARDILRPRHEQFFCFNEIPKQVKPSKLYNESQERVIVTAAEAVHQGYALPRINLTQGPPGTGKSHTIVGIIARIFNHPKNYDEKPTQSELFPDKTRVLLCAPSNEAIDELVRKLLRVAPRRERDSGNKENVRDGGVERNNRRGNIPNNCGDFVLVRVGRKSRTHDTVKHLSLDSMVRDAMTERGGSGTSANSTNLKNQLRAIDNKIGWLDKEKFQVQEALKSDGADQENCQARLKELEDDRNTLDIRRKDTDKQFKQQKHKEVQERRMETRVRKDILTRADIVCCTLSGSGSKKLLNDTRGSSGKKIPFTCVIVDEACQCCELDVLIPLQYRPSKLILVGDPEQLPATVMSSKAKELQYGRSMFGRLYKFFKVLKRSERPVHLLDIQYRMHPEIARFPSEHFYNRAIRNDSSVERRSFPLKVRYSLFDVVNGRENNDNRGGIWNSAEVNLVSDLCRELLDIPALSPSSIGIITPYRKQRAELHRRLNTMENGCEQIEVNTVDGFQGREKDVMIISCVRANRGGSGIGFLANRNRLNVSLTRARQALYVFGHLYTLESADRDWAALIDDASEREVVHEALSIRNVSEVIFETPSLPSRISQKRTRNAIDRSPSFSPGEPATKSRRLVSVLKRPASTSLDGSPSKKRVRFSEVRFFDGEQEERVDIDNIPVKENRKGLPRDLLFQVNGKPNPVASHGGSEIEVDLGGSSPVDHEKHTVHEGDSLPRASLFSRLINLAYSSRTPTSSNTNDNQLSTEPKSTLKATSHKNNGAGGALGVSPNASPDCAPKSAETNGSCSEHRHPCSAGTTGRKSSGAATNRESTNVGETAGTSLGVDERDSLRDRNGRGAGCVGTSTRVHHSGGAGRDAKDATTTKEGSSRGHNSSGAGSGRNPQRGRHSTRSRAARGNFRDRSPIRDRRDGAPAAGSWGNHDVRGRPSRGRRPDRAHFEPRFDDRRWIDEAADRVRMRHPPRSGPDVIDVPQGARGGRGGRLRYAPEVHPHDEIPHLDDWRPYGGPRQRTANARDNAAVQDLRERAVQGGHPIARAPRRGRGRALMDNVRKGRRGFGGRRGRR